MDIQHKVKSLIQEVNVKWVPKVFEDLEDIYRSTTL